ncbi:MAG: hypothetical protein MUF16_13915 [Burkholderiaceae bacterium]|jgi:hypothetical protein|nr:hypothetical protein [Burkholderiaceae bacterium]
MFTMQSRDLHRQPCGNAGLHESDADTIKVDAPALKASPGIGELTLGHTGF